VASLLVLAIRVSIHVGGFGILELGVTLGQLAVFTVVGWSDRPGCRIEYFDGPSKAYHNA
jgi:hypothetical protein